MTLVLVAAGKSINIAAENKNTMNKEETLTLKAVILYILKNCSARVSRNVYYIVKTAFVAQQKHLAKNTSARYMKIKLQRCNSDQFLPTYMMH